MFYLLARFVLRPLVFVVFRPTVTGRENVPLTGPVSGTFSRPVTVGRKARKNNGRSTNRASR